MKRARINEAITPRVLLLQKKKQGKIKKEADKQTSL